MNFLNKRLIAILHDAFMSGLALFAALVARYGIDHLPPAPTVAAWIAIFVAISAIVFKFMGLGRGLWRFASLADLRAIVVASLISIVIFVLVLFLITRLEALPRSVPVITEQLLAPLDRSDTAPLVWLAPTKGNEVWDHWWRFGPGYFTGYLPILGFSDLKVSKHEQSCLGNMFKHFTIRARRNI